MKDRSGQTDLNEVFVYRVAVQRRYVWLSVLYALLGTCGIFILLPFSELVDKPEVEKLEIRTVDRAPLKQPPPDIKDLIPPAPPQARKEPEKHVAKPKIELTKSSKRKKPRLPVLLEMGTMELAGDFTLNFTLVPQLFEAEAETDLEVKVFDLNEVDQPPRPILRDRPIYPPRAIRRNIEGYVRVLFIVNPRGLVEDTEVLESDPGDIFVEAVRQAVSNWRFEPAMKDGKPVYLRVVTNLYFQLDK